MSRRRTVVTAALAVLVLGVMAASAALISQGGQSSVKQQKIAQARMLLKGAAAPGRFDKIGNGEADRSGPSDPAVEAYQDRAFPSSVISFAQTQDANKAA